MGRSNRCRQPTAKLVAQIQRRRRSVGEQTRPVGAKKPAGTVAGQRLNG